MTLSDAEDQDVGKLAAKLRRAWKPVVVMAGWKCRGVKADVLADGAADLVPALRAPFR